MKTKFALSLPLVAMLTTLTTTMALAVELRGWERPVYSAKMKITEATGLYVNAREVTLVQTRRDGNATPTGFQLKIDGKELFFKVIEAGRNGGCGSTKFVAALAKNEPDPMVYDDMRLAVVDHSTRFCKDFRPYRWEGSFIHDQYPGPERLGTLEIKGNPAPVFTIQDKGF